MQDNVNNPKHYKEHKSGIECIQVTEHMNFNLGNAVKYIWRCDLKNDAIEDLKKAQFYINREILRRELYLKIGKDAHSVQEIEHSEHFYDTMRNQPAVAIPGYTHFKKKA